MTVKLWPGGVVPYVFSSGLAPLERNAVREALHEIESVSKVRFKKRANEKDRVTFRIDPSPHSAIGHRGGDQTVALSRPLAAGQILHEILHALGVHHEHSRPGRDEYVLIYDQNAADNRAASFLRAIEPHRDVRPYDYGSVMHYSSTAFAKNGTQTIVPRKPLPPGLVLGKSQSLSAGDIQTLRLLYP